MHALVIENDPIIAMMLEDELGELGYSSIDVAVSEAEAVAAAFRTPPDLVTSDGMLSEGSGASAVRLIRAVQAVPVVFITGDPASAREAIPDAPVLEKPFSVAELVSTIEVARQSIRPRSGFCSR